MSDFFSNYTLIKKLLLVIQSRGKEFMYKTKILNVLAKQSAWRLQERKIFEICLRTNFGLKSCLSPNLLLIQ